MSAKNLAISAMVAAVVAAATTYVLNRTGLFRDVVDVPSVIGMPIGGARALIERDGLLLSVVEEREESKIPPGQITAQRPLEGSRLYRGESVSVVVAKAPMVVKIPSVVGQPISEAKLRLETERFTVGKITEEPNGSISPGSVIKQNPEAQTEAKIGTPIDLVISKGTEMMMVPKVVGRGLNTAKKDITKAGFTVGKIRYRPDDDYDEGLVLEQTPAADQPAAKGSAVDLVVCAE